MHKLQLMQLPGQGDLSVRTITTRETSCGLMHKIKADTDMELQPWDNKRDDLSGRAHTWSHPSWGHKPSHFQSKLALKCRTYRTGCEDLREDQRKVTHGTSTGRKTYLRVQKSQAFEIPPAQKICRRHRNNRLPSTWAHYNTQSKTCQVLFFIKS